MRFSEIINEAPINDIDYHSNPHAEPSFVKKDISYLSDKNNLATIKKHLFKIPIPINLYFVNQKVKGEDREFNTKVLDKWDIVDSNYVKNTFGLDIKEDPTALTFICNTNEGDYRMPLTPWVIAHRLIHAIDTNDKKASQAISQLSIQFQMIIPDLLSGTVNALTPLDASSLMFAIGTMKSARDGRLSDVGEFIAECLTQFLVQGEIRFNKVGNEIQAKYGLRFQDSYRETTGEELSNHIIKINMPNKINDEVEYWRTVAEKQFLNILKRLLGRIIIL